MLEDDGDALSRTIHRLAVDQNLSGTRRQETADAAQERRFTATGGTDNAENFPVSYLQINITERDHRSFEEKLAGVINDDLGANSHATSSILKQRHCENNASKPANVADSS